MLWSASSSPIRRRITALVSVSWFSAALQRSVRAGSDSHHHVMNCATAAVRAPRICFWNDGRRVSCVPLVCASLHARSQTSWMSRDLFTVALMRHRLRFSDAGSAQLRGYSSNIAINRDESARTIPDASSCPAAGLQPVPSSSFMRTLLPHTLRASNSCVGEHCRWRRFFHTLSSCGVLPIAPSAVAEHFIVMSSHPETVFFRCVRSFCYRTPRNPFADCFVMFLDKLLAFVCDCHAFLSRTRSLLTLDWFGCVLYKCREPSLTLALSL